MTTMRLPLKTSEHAWCAEEDCPWEEFWSIRIAGVTKSGRRRMSKVQTSARQHHRHTGHTVYVEETRTLTLKVKPE